MFFLNVCRTSAIFIWLVAFLTGCASAGHPTTTKDNRKMGMVEPVTLDSSQIFSIYSVINKQDYRIRIRLPASYQAESSKQYPVIIKVDGQWDFLLAASAYNCIYFDGQMPETIFVGIDWGDVDGDIHAIRSRDLLPAPVVGYSNSGHAKTFANVIATEILPQLEQRFRLDGKRIVMGGSWGAMFATYALLERPDVFDGAIAIAGDYETQGNVMENKIRSLANTDILSGKRLYLGVGSWDPVAPSVKNLASEIDAASLNGFEVMLDQKEGFGHSGMNVPGYAAGFQFQFQRPQLALAKDKLTQYQGEFQAEDQSQTRMAVAVVEQNLVVTSANTTLLLQAQSENAFYHPGTFFNLKFVGDLAFVETFFGKQTFRRIR